jgi:hypothetical protein
VKQLDVFDFHLALFQSIPHPFVDVSVYIPVAHTPEGICHIRVLGIQGYEQVLDPVHVPSKANDL